jgi:NADH-quinone oxidoreductase subunit N
VSQAVNFLPETLLVATALGLLAIGRVRPRAVRFPLALAGGGSAGAVVALLVLSRYHLPAVGAGFLLDRTAFFFKGLLALALFLLLLQCLRYAFEVSPRTAPFLAMMLFATTGAMLIVSAAEMAALVVSLELLAISLVALVAFLRPASPATGLRHLILGAAGTAVLLYGLALTYGLSGHTDLAGVALAVRSQSPAPPVLLLATGLVVAGLLFKLVLAPLHAWSPGTQEGAPTAVAALASVVALTAFLGLFLRLLMTAFGGVQGTWAPPLAWVAAALITVGTLGGFARYSLKRFLAYANIAQVGYLTLAVLEPKGAGLPALLLMLLSLVGSNLAVFGALAAYPELDRAGRGHAGMGRRAPLLGGVLALGLLSLAGLPPLIGFFGKFAVLLSVARAGYAALALLAVLATVLSIALTVEVVRTIFLEVPPLEEAVHIDRPLRYSLLACSLGVVTAGVVGGPLLDVASRAAAPLLVK